MRRKKEGLPVDDDYDDANEGHIRAAPPASRRFEQLLGVDLGTSNLRLANVPLDTEERIKFVRIIESADGSREIPAAVAVDNDSVTVGAVARALLGRKPGHTAMATRLLLGRRPGEVHNTLICCGNSFLDSRSIRGMSSDDAVFSCLSTRTRSWTRSPRACRTRSLRATTRSRSH